MSGQTMLVIDFGTTFTTAVWATRGEVRSLDLDSGETKMPSAVFRTRDGHLVCGRVAENQAAIDPSSFEPTPKRRLGQPSVLLGGVEIDTVDLIAAILARVADEARRQGNGALPDEIRLTHPASWREGRRTALVQAAGRAGLGRVSLVPEPIAAAAHYVHRIGTTKGMAPAPGSYIAVYDLGGGTFDTAVVRVAPSAPAGLELVGTVGGIDPLGGVDFDHRLLSFVGSRVATAHGEAWGCLCESEELVWARARRDALMACRSAKEALSRTPTHTLFVPVLNADVLVTRDDFEGLVQADVARTIDTLVSVVAAAGVSPGQLHGVYLVGGSSRIPLIADMVWERLKTTPTTLEDPKAAVALGGALWRSEAVTAGASSTSHAQRAAGATPPPPPPPPPPGPTPTDPTHPSAGGGTRSTPAARRRSTRSIAAAGVGAVVALISAFGVLSMSGAGDGPPPTTTTVDADRGDTTTRSPSSQDRERVLVSGDDELTFGDAHSANLVSEADIGSYEFEGIAGETVRIIVHSLDARALDPRVTLLGPEGEVVVEGTDISATNRNNEVQVNLDSTGLHRVEVSTETGPGEYDLIVEVDDLVGESATPEEVFTADEQRLWSQIPDTIDGFCLTRIPGGAGATASFRCSTDDDYDSNARYELYPSENAMAQAYDTWGGVEPDSGELYECPAERVYTRGDRFAGRVKCYVDGDLGAYVVFTTSCDLNILVVVTHDDDDPEFDSLWTLWREGALGPLCT